MGKTQGGPRHEILLRMVLVVFQVKEERVGGADEFHDKLFTRLKLALLTCRGWILLCGLEGRRSKSLDCKWTLRDEVGRREGQSGLGVWKSTSQSATGSPRRNCHCCRGNRKTEAFLRELREGARTISTRWS